MSQDTVHSNFIDGEWVAGPLSIENINPSDTSDAVGRYAQESSYGPREQGRYAAEFHTTVKTAYIAP